MKLKYKLIPSSILVILLAIGLWHVDASANTKRLNESSNAKQITIVNYHFFGEKGSYPQIENIRLSGQAFKEQLQALKDNGYTTITQKQLVDYVKGHGHIPQNSVLLTIDDGYESVYSIAYPILKEMSMNAVIFPITAEMQLGFRKKVPMMTFEQLGELVSSGVFEVGSHTHDLHWRGNGDKIGFEAMTVGFDKNGKPLTDAERKEWIKNDIKISEQLIFEATGVTTKAISFPYGKYDSVSLSAYKELGYEVGYSVVNGYNLFGSGVKNALELNRIGVNHEKSASWLIDRLNTYNISAINQINNEKKVVVSTSYNNVLNSLRVQTHATSTTSNKVKNVQFELYRTLNDDGTNIDVPSFRLFIPTMTSKQADFTDVFPIAQTYADNGNGSYTMKILLTMTDGSQQIEWVNYNYN